MCKLLLGAFACSLVGGLISASSGRKAWLGCLLGAFGPLGLFALVFVLPPGPGPDPDEKEW